MHTRLEGRRDLKSDFLGILSCKKVNLIGIGARPPQNIQKIPWMLKCSSCSLVQGIKFVTTEKGSPGHLAVLGKAGSPSCEKAVKLWGSCPCRTGGPGSLFQNRVGSQRPLGREL